MKDINKRLEDLNIILPKGTKPAAKYIPVQKSNNLIFVSGQDCRVNGELAYKGKIGSDLTIEQGKEAARQSAINCIATIQDYIGDLNNISKIIKMLSFVNSAPGFTEQPYVVNGASELLVNIFGNRGTHARSAISSNELPFDTPIETELIVEIK